MSILDGATILITGGTGSFGKKFVNRTLAADFADLVPMYFVERNICRM
jgi:FlaA1/EpsC-like NDP-sugar epimerase